MNVLAQQSDKMTLTKEELMRIAGLLQYIQDTHQEYGLGTSPDRLRKTLNSVRQEYRRK